MIRSDHGTEAVDAFAAHKSFHEHSIGGNVDQCWKYGRSVNNQKIECFWSQLVNQWLARWQDIFRELESDGLWELGDEYDQLALVYIYMPVIQEELDVYRREYNTYPMRYNNLSRLPCGPPEDNYLLHSGGTDCGISIDGSWLELVKRHRLRGFDSEQYLDSHAMEELDELMTESPFGPLVTDENARDQYLFLRHRLHHE